MAFPRNLDALPLLPPGTEWVDEYAYERVRVAIANVQNTLLGAPGVFALGTASGNPLRGVNVNHETGAYTQVDPNYNEASGITFGNYALTRTANRLDRGPVWNRITEDERDFRRIAKWGFNYINCGLDWHWWGGSDPTTPQAKQAFAFTDQIVAWCRKYGMRVVFRMYVPRGGMQTFAGNGMVFWGSLISWANQNWGPDGTTPATQYMINLRDFWKMFVTRYASEPVVSGYDLLNEAATAYTYDVLFWYYGALVDYLTPFAPNQFFVLQSSSGGQWAAHPAIINRLNVYYSHHVYGPLSVTTPDRDGPYFAYPGYATDFDSLGVAALNGAALATGNLNLAYSFLPAGGGTVVIDGEAITYSSIRNWQAGDPGPSTTTQGRTSGMMLVTLRGALATTAATHAAFAPVMPGCVLNAPILLGDVMTGAGVVTFTTAAAWAQFPSTGAAMYFVLDNETFTYTGKTALTATGVTRAAFGTVAAAHAVGAPARHAKYWNQAVLDNVFRVGARLDLSQRPFEFGEVGSRKASGGYRTWLADWIGLANSGNAAWISGWAIFNYREFDSTFDFGMVNGPAGGTYLSLTPVAAADMSSGANPVLDQALITALAALVPGNPAAAIF